MDWYGLKFDLVSREIMLKVVLGADCFLDQPLQPFPRGAKFYARIHRPDGSVVSLSSVAKRGDDFELCSYEPSQPEA